MGGSMMGGIMWPMALGMLLFWTLLIVGVVLLVRLLATRTDGGQQGALRILEERFASGAVNIEEYQSRRDVLRSRR